MRLLASPAALSSACAASAEPAELAAEAIADLRDDLGELLFTAEAARARLRSVAADLEAACADLHPGTLAMLLEQLSAAQRRLDALGRRLRALRASRPSRPLEQQACASELAAAKVATADLLRCEQALVGALATAADWQSPSFLHSIRPAAGRQAGRIAPHWSDYKRDRHLDAREYERAYVDDLVDGPADIRALLAGCGMAAFATILASLHMARRLTPPVVIGRALYHESKELIERALPGMVHQVDERDTAALLRALRTLRPGAVFLDTLCNTRWAPLPDVPAVLDAMRDRDAFLVLDNTGLSASFQPFRQLRDADRLHLVVFESLLKYPQLGLDRANGGVIVARGADAELFERDREHLGTNIGDAAVQSLPPPSRPVLERRLARLGRNATLLAERLAKAAAGEPAVEVVYPGLADHPSHHVARRLAFTGGCLAIASTPERERRFVAAALAEARRRGVPLIGGSSFGFDTTRVYLTAARTHHGESFVRVAAGTEDRLAVGRLGDALAAALMQVVR
jgi:cystathionine beta-lyase/cystathionine gamma-synthase